MNENSTDTTPVVASKKKFALPSIANIVSGVGATASVLTLTLALKLIQNKDK